MEGGWSGLTLFELFALELLTESFAVDELIDVHRNHVGYVRVVGDQRDPVATLVHGHAIRRQGALLTLELLSLLLEPAFANGVLIRTITIVRVSHHSSGHHRLWVLRLGESVNEKLRLVHRRLITITEVVSTPQDFLHIPAKHHIGVEFSFLRPGPLQVTWQ